MSTWRKEYGRLRQEYEAEYAEYKPIRADLMKLLQVKSCVDTARRQDMER